MGRGPSPEEQLFEGRKGAGFPESIQKRTTLQNQVKSKITQNSSTFQVLRVSASPLLPSRRPHLVDLAEAHTQEQEEANATGGAAACGGRYNWQGPEQSLDRSRWARSWQCAGSPSFLFRHKVACEGFLCAHQAPGQSPMRQRELLVNTISEGLRERSRIRITEELSTFFKVHNQEAAKVGDLDRHREAHEAIM